MSMQHRRSYPFLICRPKRRSRRTERVHTPAPGRRDRARRSAGRSSARRGGSSRRSKPGTDSVDASEGHRTCIPPGGGGCVPRPCRGRRRAGRPVHHWQCAPADLRPAGVAREGGGSTCADGRGSCPSTTGSRKRSSLWPCLRWVSHPRPGWSTRPPRSTGTSRRCTADSPRCTRLHHGRPSSTRSGSGSASGSPTDSNRTRSASRCRIRWLGEKASAALQTVDIPIVELAGRCAENAVRVGTMHGITGLEFRAAAVRDS